MKIIKEEVGKKDSIKTLEKYDFYIFKKKMSDGRTRYDISKDCDDLYWVDIDKDDDEYVYFVDYEEYQSIFLDKLHDALEDDIIEKDGKEYINFYVDGKETEVEFPTEDDIEVDDRVRQSWRDGSIDGYVTSSWVLYI